MRGKLFKTFSESDIPNFDVAPTNDAESGAHTEVGIAFSTLGKFAAARAPDTSARAICATCLILISFFGKHTRNIITILINRVHSWSSQKPFAETTTVYSYILLCFGVDFNKRYWYPCSENNFSVHANAH